MTGVLLGLDVLLGLAGSPWQSPYGVRLALLAAVVGGGRVIYLALEALLEGRNNPLVTEIETNAKPRGPRAQTRGSYGPAF